jgi:type I restriction-modification system DNA methylase subunit
MNKRKLLSFREVLSRLSHRHNTASVFTSFVRLTACAFAAQTREAEYLEEAKQWEKPELEIFAEALAALVLEMEGHPFEDLLGAYYMESALSKKGQQWNGEFHTPKPVCDLMARMTVGDPSSLPAEGPITVCEPACGSGAMILSLAEACSPEVRRRLRVTAIDINCMACDMTFINTTLWGVPTRIIHGNSLSNEYWAAWSNIHWLMPWLSLLPMHPVSAMSPPSPTLEMDQGAPPEPQEVKQITEALRQGELAF